MADEIFVCDDYRTETQSITKVAAGGKEFVVVDSSDDEVACKRPLVVIDGSSDDEDVRYKRPVIDGSSDHNVEDATEVVVIDGSSDDEDVYKQPAIDGSSDDDNVVSIREKDHKHYSKGHYYKNNKSLPVFERNASSRTYDLKRTFAVLVDHEVDSSKICNTVPINIEHNCTFVVNQTKLAHPSDIRADDCGVWKNNGVRPSVVHWEKKEVTVVAQGSKKCGMYDMVPGDFTINRTYFIHKSYEDFRKVLSIIKDYHGNLLELALVQYYFTGDEHIILKSAHGNAKGKSPYKRTRPSTMFRMKELSKDMGPVKTMEAMDDEVGDIVGQCSSSSRLRNLAQVSSARRKLKLETHVPGTLTGYAELAQVMEMCKKGHGTNNELFVRCVQAAPEPMCILASDRQLDEMIRNCTKESHFVCLGVDPTFKLGDFYVTPIVFPLRMLVTKSYGNSPIYLGPMLVHQTQQFSAYNYFASQLLGLRKELSDIRAIGTDGETALYDAFSCIFPKSIHLRCFSHFKRNIKDKLHSLGFPAYILKEIINDIFGVKTEEVHHVGLVDCFDDKEFRPKLDMLKQRWNTLEEDHRLRPMGKDLEPEFHKWFCNEKANTIVKCMLKGVRAKAGMGHNPNHFYTNMNESINKTLKSRTDYKAQQLRQFIDKMFTFHQSQENLLKKAVIRNDRWRFREDYQHLHVDSDKWFTMSEKAQKQHLKKVYLEPLAPRTSISNSEENGTQLLGSALSIPYESIINSHRITTDTLKDIWEKATTLVNNSDFISKVPGQADTCNRMVASLNGGEPHYVSRKSNNQFICSGVCHRFSTYKICQHIVAACEQTQTLSQFCEWWTCKVSGPDLDSLALSGLPKGVAGNKGGVAKRSRKRQRNEATPICTKDRVAMVAQTDTPVHTTCTNQDLTYAPIFQPSTPQSSFSIPYTGTPFQPHGLQPYSVKMLTKRIHVCAGCRLGFNNENNLPPSPYNICIAHDETRQVTPSGKTPFPKKITAHYHANPSCIWFNDNLFLPQSLQVPPDVLQQLDATHKHFLMEYFSVNIL